MEWAEHTGSGKWWRTQSPGQGLSQNKGWEKPAPAAPGLCSSSAEPPRHWAQPWAAEGPLSEQKLQEHALPSGKHEVLGARQRHCCSATAALSPTPGEEHLKLGKALTGHKVERWARGDSHSSICSSQRGTTHTQCTYRGPQCWHCSNIRLLPEKAKDGSYSTENSFELLHLQFEMHLEFFPGGFLPSLVSKKLLWDTTNRSIQHSCSVLLTAQHGSHPAA